MSALSLQTTGISWFLAFCTPVTERETVEPVNVRDNVVYWKTKGKISNCKCVLLIRLASLGVSCHEQQKSPRYSILFSAMPRRWDHGLQNDKVHESSVRCWLVQPTELVCAMTAGLALPIVHPPARWRARTAECLTFHNEQPRCWKTRCWLP